MRISERTHPALKLFSIGGIANIPYFDERKIKHEEIEIVRQVKKWLPQYIYKCKKLTFIANPFIDAYIQSSQKISDLYSTLDDKVDRSDFEISETLIYHGGASIIDRKFNEKLNNYETAFFHFSREGMPLLMFIYNESVADKENGEIFCSPHYLSTQNIDKTAIEQYTFEWVGQCLGIQLFKKYAEVETKFLPAGSKVKGIDCKYVNDTKVDITYLDSTWFTTLVKSDAFKVRGHFRFQAYGEGMKERKLIWISDFQKSGYTSPAKKLDKNP